MPQIFISHASEDKDAFVRPLVHALKAYGLRVWYDEFSLRPGDSLRRSIDHGLAECNAGLVVLSPSFFAKEWPQRELDALFTAEIAGRSRLIPVWHQVDFKTVAEASPLLADRFAIRGELGVEAVASKIAEQFPVPEKYTGMELADILQNCQHSGLFAGEAFYAGCVFRFLALNAFKEEYEEIFETAVSDLADEELEDFPEELYAKLKAEQDRLRRKYRIPDDAYLTTDETVREEELGWWRDTLGSWASGTLSREKSGELVQELDLDELDEYYVLICVPNFAISSGQRPLLQRALVELGCGFEDGYEHLQPICAELRAIKRDG